MERTSMKNTNPPDRLLRREEVERRCGLGRATIYRLMRLGQFPIPIKISQRGVRWPQREIESWIANRPRATGEKPHNE